MAEIKIPETPQEAFALIEKAAAKLNWSVKVLCAAAGVYHTTVYRWQNNSRTYDIAQYRKVREYADNVAKMQKAAKAREKKK